MAEIHPNDIGLATFEDVGDVSDLRTSAKQIVAAINEIMNTGGGTNGASGGTFGGGVFGEQWYVEGENNVVIGTNNIVYGNNNMVIGSDNIVVGDNINVVSGNECIYEPSDFRISDYNSDENKLYYYIESEDNTLHVKVGDRLLIQFMQSWTDESYTTWYEEMTPFKLVEILEINEAESYMKITETDLMIPPDPTCTVLQYQYPTQTILLCDVCKNTGMGTNIIFGGAALGKDSFAVCNGEAHAECSFAANVGIAKGTYSAAFGLSEAEGTNSFAVNSGRCYGDYGMAFNDSFNFSPYSTSSGRYSRTFGRPLKCVSLNVTTKELTVEEGQDLSELTGKNIILRVYNKSNQIMFTEATVESINGNVITLKDVQLGSGEYATQLFPESFAFRKKDSVLKSNSNFVGGYYSVASGNYTFAYGQRVLAAADGATIFGKYANLAEPYALALGNGNSLKEPGLAFKVLPYGSVHADAEFSTPCADYAEFFEWEDGNKSAEDRVGYFVKLSGDKISKCDDFDTPLGIVSATPAIIGDSGELHWKNKFLTDDFGRLQYHEVTIPEEKDEEGNIIEEEHIEVQPVINPEWNSEEKYVPRKERPEWSAVGVLGKLIVYDDGTLKAGDKCRPGNGGIAVKSIENGYQVLKRISQDKVLIWFGG